jgi:hypothetical protein
MDELFSLPPGGSWWDSPEATEHLDPTLDRRVLRRRWEVRCAQWRAWVLAEAAFGPPVLVTLSGGAEVQSFRGLLNLRIPFRNLEDHWNREALFLAWAEKDPVLARVPVVFVFEPAPVRMP